MKKLFGVAMLAGATVVGASGVANAEVSGSVAFTTDYIFRGISQTGSGAAVQGSLDWTQDIFYAGAWGSNLSFTNGMELDVYGGVTPEFGPFSMNFGVIGYLYPAASDDFAEFDYWELKAAGSISPVEALTVGASINYSPEFFGETGDGLYLEGNASYAFSDALSFSGLFANQSIDDVDGPGAGTVDGDYNTWNLGGSYAMHGFKLDLRYYDTDIDVSDAIATFATTDESLYDGAIVATVSRAL